ncbi:hypothetical protein CWS43_10960 [Rahnella sp. AA]|uniref:hypothetical protein n=1 Tax=Rahnella sp. AA TaxID=2057180 RepID=UPI000C345C8B|nr:hypothetical protein [Rahnella sp. AA]PKE30146.1 hypothetical protein CWS43_10960 [Rahnella sp. AA]
MSLRTSLCLLSLPLFTGCQYFPHTTYFNAPDNEPNPAWVRIVNNTQHAAIYQYENGVRSGGVVRSGPLPFINTQDMGMPKAGQDLTFDYYETRVRPDIKTEVAMMWEGPRTKSCYITIQFIPKAGHYYQFMLNEGSGDLCTSAASLIERDKDGTAWHLTPNPDVTYKYNGPAAKKRFNNSSFEDPNFHPNPELYPGTAL